MNANNTDIIRQNRIFMWIALATGLLLSLPLIAKWDWTLSDFVVMGAMLFGTGFGFVLVARATPREYRVPLGIAFVAAFLWLWAELAVGVFTNWGS